MNVLCRVNQAEAMRRGIDAPNSTVQIDVDPAALTETERQVLAAVMIDGHDCTRLGIRTQTADIVGQAWRGSGDRIDLRSDGAPTAPLMIVQPDIIGLQDAIAEMLAARDAAYAIYVAEAEAAAAKEAQEQARRDARDRRVIGALLRGGAKFRDEDGRGGLDGTTSIYDDCVFIDCPTEGVTNYKLPRTPEIEPAIQAYQARREAWEQERSRQAEAEAARQAEAKAAEKAEWDALYARLPQALRDRHAAGYATGAEVERAIKIMIREDAGYPGHHDGWDDSVKLTSLTDAEFARLREAQAHAPEGATVEARECWDDAQREADDGDNPDDVDDDDGMVHYRQNERRQIVVTWHHAGMRVRAVLPLTA
jgi:hypothetical protein